MGGLQAGGFSRRPAENFAGAGKRAMTRHDEDVKVAIFIVM
jgi:hypothetical protein